MSAHLPTPRVVGDAQEAPADWPARAVTLPGGHVLQSATWGEYRASQGDEPHYLTFDDGRGALVLLRRSRGLPGSDAVVRRGPAHGDDSPELAAARALALADWARTVGARSLFLDPEREADPAYARAMASAGFAVTPGLEPSIHVMRLDFTAAADEAAVLAGCTKSTRQRIRAAERAGTRVREDREGERLDAFAALLRERAEVVGMQLQAGSAYLRGWRTLLAAGLARLLLAEHEDELLGGLLLFRQGGIHATAFSADRASRRHDLPGTMHLVRWAAIRDAFAEGCPAIELGGVDLPGLRHPPEPGDPNRGLYEHKRGFGARWVEREPPRRIVLRPGAERVAQARRRLVGALRGVRR